MYSILDPLDFSVWDFGLIKLHPHMVRKIKTDFGCLVNLGLSRHGIMSEEYDKLSLGLDEFWMGLNLV